jgi:hypothetical protein
LPRHALHSQTSTIGALVSWGNTVNRTERTEPARAASPSSNKYWLDRLDPDRFADATDQQKLDAANAMRRAYYQRLAYASAKARSRKAAAPPRDAA